jgi:hypothetical protein
MMLPTRVIRAAGTPSASEIGVGVGRRRPQHVRDRVGGDPVDLLGHRPVARAQARLEMDGR